MASNSSGVKTTLFRFATVRQAEQITPTEDDVFFIKMPTPAVTPNPYFYQAAKDIDKETLEERQSELKSLIESYRNTSSWLCMISVI